MPLLLQLRGLVTAERIPESRSQGAGHYLTQGRPRLAGQDHETPWFRQAVIWSPGSGGDHLLDKRSRYWIGLEFSGAASLAERDDD
jgi:hypothetical protein